MPRSNRTIATLGDGYVFCQPESHSRRSTTYNLNLDGDFTNKDPRKNDPTNDVNDMLNDRVRNLQNCHSRREPEFLRAHKMETRWVPCTRVRIVAVAHDDEDPGTGKSQPADETVVAAVRSQ